MKNLLWIILLAIFALQLACTSTNNQAPVVDGWKQSNRAGGDYRVQPNDSLYSIAWAFGLDYHDLARYNQLSEPYALHAGQMLHMYPPEAAPVPPQQSKTTEVAAAPPVAVTPTVAVNSSAANSKQTGIIASQSASIAAQQAIKTSPPPAVVKPTTTAVTATRSTTEKWLWPTKGRVVHGYSTASGGNHGLDIAGKLNQPIMAAASGKVVYAGSGMPGYGNLIIIKHNENDLSAYAFNKTLAVKEGDSVKAGQCIAYMGKNDAGQTLLHFEIRRDGKPVDPKGYLR
ncbi:MAG TPA: peptidoglycan DD-metalloendopeptidase family protein [Gammaproteobacteria bacterium]|nr:peptidoglycan DD-metalloendopeptidase family protein [Gammaproteobacteria bacterium]